MCSPASIPADAGNQGWHASLRLCLETKEDKTILEKTSRKGPLTIQQPLYAEDGTCHIYLLHPPGGLVGGDVLDLAVDAGQNTHTLLTTPGATKFYRSQGQRAVQTQTLAVAEGAVLQWFPQETILFEGAMGSLGTTINLAPKAVFMGWEILCLGLPALKKPFAGGHLTSTVTLFNNSIPLLFEKLKIEKQSDLCGPAGLRNQPVTATFWAYPVPEQLFSQVQNSASILGECFGMTLMDDLLVARYLGDHPGQAKEQFEKLRHILAPELTGRQAAVPRIWNT
ncbi:urease accessory protein UreD [uncultured Desulfobacter sp.]|uniref:urease accessory protein UreD n=1 Tax=uncultured Desulfobacter sp. TaxID=240139 RepID=UPI002AAB0BC6|nr:urease accessory protein UreD [uncultured Desulfobacter sp.]